MGKGVKAKASSPVCLLLFVNFKKNLYSLFFSYTCVLGNVCEAFEPLK